MDEQTLRDAHERFEQEESAVRKKVTSIKRTQNILWLLCIAIAAIFFGGMAIAHFQYQMPLVDLANDALPILMGTTLLITTLYVVFILLYFASVRAIYHSHSVIHPRLNDFLHPDEQRPFHWHSYFRKHTTDIEMRSKGAATVITLKVVKIVTMFALILICQFSWMGLLEISGKEMIDEYYSFLGLVDLTLFSSVVLFVIVLVAVRVGVLGKRNKEHKRAKSIHPPEDPNRAR
ncbi:MAG: hypothetical protein CO187_07345 [Zetaproteobacteria bacterium CG_4_9_14_3_um_filter_53_7]|nr:MAG: hypothetical protein CO187_07345 [Zetaproteobacteria bacterium CG_4_9_14_3_um_filter_53_7]